MVWCVWNTKALIINKTPLPVAVGNDPNHTIHSLLLLLLCLGPVPAIHVAPAGAGAGDSPPTTHIVRLNLAYISSRLLALIRTLSNTLNLRRARCCSSIFDPQRVRKILCKRANQHSRHTGKAEIEIRVHKLNQVRAKSSLRRPIHAFPLVPLWSGSLFSLLSPLSIELLRLVLATITPNMFLSLLS